jgi:signal transduction histidine kinase
MWKLNKIASTIKFSIQKKLLFSFCIVPVLLIGLLAVSIQSLNMINKAIKNLELYEKHFEFSINIQESTLEIINVVDKILLKKEIGTDYTPLVGKFQTATNFLLTNEQNLKLLVDNTVNKKLLNSWSRVHQTLHDFVSLSKVIIELVQREKLNEAKKLHEKVAYKTKENFLIATEILLEEHSKLPLSEFKNVDSYNKNLKKGLIFFTLFIIFIGFGIFYILSYIIANPILKLREATKKIGLGDLDTKINIKSQDEIGGLVEDFKKMTTNLKQAQDKFIQTEKLAALGKVAGMISHELKNPLGTMKNALSVIKMNLENNSDEKPDEYLDIISKEIQVSNKIITDVLTFARLKKPELNSTNVRDILDTTISNLEKPKNVTISLSIYDGIPHIFADKDQLIQIFSNIFQNAIQAMPNGGIIHVDIKPKNEALEIQFSDDGIGIPKENIDKIFDPLFSTKPQGTGLGLSVCQSLVSNHSGSIEVHSEIDFGATFIIRIPLFPKNN